MKILRNVSLKKYNTFGVDVIAKDFYTIDSKQDLEHLLSKNESIGSRNLILGGGSNVLLMDDIDIPVFKISISGKEIVRENADHVWIKVGAGELWHDFVIYCIEHQWSGVENLSLIPGTVGAAPMQNIGAYGVEIKSVFDTLEAVHIASGHTEVFDKEQCCFGYRESIFKNTHKGKYIICSVTFRLNKKAKFNISYGAIQETLKLMGVEKPDLKSVSDAVIRIRQSKLPDPKDIGNAGSFFKNPSIDRQDFEQLKITYPDIPGYPSSENKVKVPAGWLIEQCGWKGKRRADIGVHELQALVLVNYGAGTGNRIWQLAMDIRDSVNEKFGIQIEPEVNRIS